MYSDFRMTKLTGRIGYNLPFPIDSFKNNHKGAIFISGIPRQKILAHHIIGIITNFGYFVNFKI